MGQKGFKTNLFAVINVCNENACSVLVFYEKIFLVNRLMKNNK